MSHYDPTLVVLRQAARVRYAAVAVGRGRTVTSRFLPRSSHLVARTLAGPTTGFRGAADIDGVLRSGGILQL